MPKVYEIRLRVTAEGVEVIDGAGRSLKRMERAAGGVDNKLQRVSRTLESIGKKSMLLGAGIVAGVGVVAYAGIKYNASVEMMKRKLEIFLKTNERVSAAFKWAQEAVLGTPLMTAQMVENIVTLEQSGVAYKRWGKIVSDTAAAMLSEGEDLGTQMMEYSKAIGRIAIGDTAMGIQRLRDLGIAVHEVGLKFNKKGQAIESTGVILEKVRKYLLKFEGSTEELGKTFTGRIAAMKGQLIRLLGAGMEPAFDELNTQLERLITWVRSPEGQKQIKEWARSFGEMMVSGTKLAKVLAENLLPKVKELIDWFAKLSEKKQIALVLFPLIGGAALTVAGKIATLIDTLKIFKKTAAACAVTRAGCAAGFEAIGAGGAAAGAGAGKAAKGLAKFKGVAKGVGAVAAVPILWEVGHVIEKEMDKRIQPELEKNRAILFAKYKTALSSGFVTKEAMGAAIRAMEKRFPTEARSYRKVMASFEPGPMGPRSALETARLAGTMGPRSAAEDAALRGGGGAGGGTGGGAGGGIGTRGARGITIYQTIENVEIKANEIDAKSFLKTARELVKTESSS